MIKFHMDKKERWISVVGYIGVIDIKFSLIRSLSLIRGSMKSVGRN